MSPKFCPAFLLLVCLGALAGCHHVSTTAQRDASFAPYTENMIPDRDLGGEIDLRSYAAFRTVLVSSPNGSVGSGAAVDQRGYLVTAAHAVSEHVAFVQIWRNLPKKNSSRKPAWSSEEAHIVWRGDIGKGEPDLAVLYVARPPEWVFEWSSEPRPNEPAVSAGLNYAKDYSGGFSSGAAAGKLLDSKPRKSATPHWILVIGNLPLHSGDSGGPLITPAGRLVGVNFAAGSFLRPGLSPPRLQRSWISHAARPDLLWLRQIIDEDYAKRPSAPAIAAFWRRADSAEFLARTLVDGLRELEAARLASGGPDDNRAAYNRQERVRKILADHAGLIDPSFLPVLSALPRISASETPTPADFDKLATMLREQFQMN